jgi:lipid-A-disaccharide synthase
MGTAALRVAMVAGEASGDLLGARVISALRRQFGDRLLVEGVGGEAMQAAGLRSLYPLERLAVMGLVEPLARLPELLRIRRELVERFSTQQPRFFLGIDAQDFNLGLARRLRDRGLRTAQLVSPTVWAWRPRRVHRVARALDTLLCLFPFEPSYYEGLDVDARFVGHPLAEELAEVPERAAARATLGIAPGATVIALLPGSRQGEVEQLASTFIDAGALLRSRSPDRLLLMPAAGEARYGQCQSILAQHPRGADVRLLRGEARTAMLAADVVLLASGTASLEAMLLQRPMVIAYRVAPLTWSIMSRLAVTRFVGLPNVLAGDAVVPELLQDALSAPALALAAEDLLFAPQRQLEVLAAQRGALRADFDAEVVDALRPLLEDRA